LTKGIITSRTKLEDHNDLLIAPNSLYAYTVGKNALSKLEDDLEGRDRVSEFLSS